jgi:hypothetical protein
MDPQTFPEEKSQHEKLLDAYKRLNTYEQMQFMKRLYGVNEPTFSEVPMLMHDAEWLSLNMMTTEYFRRYDVIKRRFVKISGINTAIVNREETYCNKEPFVSMVMTQTTLNLGIMWEIDRPGGPSYNTCVLLDHLLRGDVFWKSFQAWLDKNWKDTDILS